MKLMKWGLFAVVLGLAGVSRAASPYGETLEKENWSSISMEGAAILGELRYQQGDFSEARDTFRDSINSSMGVNLPHSPVMALDLYRSAELSLARGSVPEARKHLEILMARYPNTEWGIKGLALLNALNRAGGADSGEEWLDPSAASQRPGYRLERIKESVKSRPQLALALTVEFLSRHPHHPAAAEIRLLEGLLYLRLGDARSAARGLGPIAREGANSALRAKAVYLLAAAQLALGRHEAVRSIVPDVDPAKAWNKWIALSQVWLAAAEERLGDPAGAARRYRRVVKSAPKSALKAYAHAALASHSDRQGRLKKALKHLGRAGRIARRRGMTDLSGDVLLSQGHVNYKLRRLKTAAAAYGKLAHGWPGHPQRTLALYQQGLSLKRIGALSDAASTLTSLVKDYPDTIYSADAHLHLGEIYSKTGSRRRAIKHYQLMGGIGGEASRIESILLIARVHYNAKRYRQAIPLYWSFLQDTPSDPRAHQVQELLLNAYWMGAREDPGLYRAAELYPNHPIVDRIRWRLARQAYAGGDCRQAVNNFRGFEARFPASPRIPESLYLRGECMMKLEDWRGASKAFAELKARFPKSKLAAKAAFKHGQALYEAGDYRGSARAYRRVSGGRGRIAADAVYNQALAYGKSGLKKRALASYEKLLKRFPRHSRTGSVWLEVGKLRESLGRPRKAIKAYSRSRGYDQQALFRVGRLWESLKSPRRARRTYQKLYRTRPRNNTYRLHGLVRLGLLYELQGRPMDAMRLYAEVLKGPRTQFFEVARKRLNALARDGSLLSGR